jgi:hypothetical protein
MLDNVRYVKSKGMLGTEIFRPADEDAVRAARDACR